MPAFQLSYNKVLADNQKTLLAGYPRGLCPERQDMNKKNSRREFFVYFLLLYAPAELRWRLGRQIQNRH